MSISIAIIPPEPMPPPRAPVPGTITEIILAALAQVPAGLTSSEVAEHTRMASYTVGSRLSKLAAYGVISAEKIGRGKMRWKFIPTPAPAP